MTEKDHEFISTLERATVKGRVEWVPTAGEDDFTASFKGKFNVLIRKRSMSSGASLYSLSITDSADQQIFGVTP